MEKGLIKLPAHVEAGYRAASKKVITDMHATISTTVDNDIDPISIGLLTNSLRDYISSTTRNGEDSDGRYNYRRAGTWYKKMRAALLATEKRHRKLLVKLVKQETKRDTSHIVTRAKYMPYLRDKMAENVTLMRDVSIEQITQVESLLVAAWQTTDLDREALALDIAKVQNKGLNRARLVAENEIVNVHSDLQMARFEDVGVETYVWRTSADGRVRILHNTLNGQEFTVGEPTNAEEGLPPGRPIGCRCVAIPTFVVNN